MGSTSDSVSRIDDDAGDGTTVTVGRGRGRGTRIGVRGAASRRAAVLATGLLLTISGTATATATMPLSGPDVPVRYAEQQLTWGECGYEPAPGAAAAECALITVPRDWAEPRAGTDLRVSISRVRASGQSHGALLVNPGGPGAQGSSLAGRLAGLRPELAASYDLIGMDPRGTGQEGVDPGLVCQVPSDDLPENPGLDARDRSPQSISDHVRTPKATARACEDVDTTRYVTTWQTAHDMDLVRALLGESRLNYLGYSYGSWLGAKYASLFPGRTGRIVLDSSVDWQGRLQAAFEDFPRIDQRQFDEVYLPWIVRNLPEGIGDNVADARATWENVRAYYADAGVSPDAFDRMFVGMGSELQWLLASAIFSAGAQELAGGPDESAGGPDGNAGASGEGVSRLLDERSRAVFGVPVAELSAPRVRAYVEGQGAAAGAAETTEVAGARLAVACGDQRAPSADWYRRLSDHQGPRYPLYGWAYGLSETCGHWTAPPENRLPRLPLSVASRVLVVQGEFDPQTGYEQARSAVRAAPGTGMLSVDNDTFHGQYALGGNTCVDAAVERFMLDGDRLDKETCPGTPLPSETVVYPTHGPVEGTEGQAARRQAGGEAGTLRETARESVSHSNHL